MLTKTENLYSGNNLEYLEIDEFVNLIKFSNENTEVINTLRSLEYKSEKYEKVKKKLTSCIMFHGEFNSISNSDINKLSNYLFYDIDNVDNIYELKKSLIDFGVNVIWKSVGGRGLHFLIKCDGLTIDNFNIVHNFMYNHLVSLGFNVDKSAKGLSRKSYLSYDENIYVGNDTFLNVKDEIISVGSCTFYLNNSSTNLSKSNQTKKKRYKGNDTFLDLTLIPLYELLPQIKLKTELEVKEDYLINEMEWVDILIPKKIKDGLKHTIYRRVMFQLSYLNNNITPNQLYSYLYYINKERVDVPMKDIVLRKLIINTIKYIKNNEIVVKMRNKKIHLNNNYTSKQKEELGGKINGVLRNNESIKKIKYAKEELKVQGKKITRVNVAEFTGLSLITVKKNWDKELREIIDVIPTRVDEVQLERETKLNELISIDEEDFWEGFTAPKSKLEEEDVYDGDFGEGDGIDGFIETYDI
jgi:hypothetical protein